MWLVDLGGQPRPINGTLTRVQRKTCMRLGMRLNVDDAARAKLVDLRPSERATSADEVGVDKERGLESVTLQNGIRDVIGGAKTIIDGEHDRARRDGFRCADEPLQIRE